MKKLDKVNRVEVIDKNGRQFTRHDIKDVKVDYQDGGETMKVFVDWKKTPKYIVELSRLGGKNQGNFRIFMSKTRIEDDFIYATAGVKEVKIKTKTNLTTKDIIEKAIKYGAEVFDTKDKAKKEIELRETILHNLKLYRMKENYEKRQADGTFYRKHSFNIVEI